MFSKKNPFYQGPKSDHFDGVCFFNKRPHKFPSFLDFIKWKMFSKPKPFPSRKLKPKPKISSLENNQIRVTFIGHACFLVETKEFNLIIDPFFSPFAGPVKIKRNQRKTPPGIAFDDLPKIDYVLVSHSHYDHCDLNYLKKLEKAFHPLFIVPLGLDRLLQKKAVFENMQALDWNQSISPCDNLEIFLTESLHWSSRTLSDKNMTLWGGFYIKAFSKGLYFCGDSGFSLDLFEELKKRYKKFDLALLPLGAYQPRFFMKSSHMDPEESVLLSQLLEAKKSIGMHFNTLNLADESRDDPVIDLKKALKKHQVSNNAFCTLDEGFHYIF